ncbi:hypothetical protein U1Q18_012730 [Sarracenia purpurea var. burkii]
MNPFLAEKQSKPSWESWVVSSLHTTYFSTLLWYSRGTSTPTRLASSKKPSHNSIECSVALLLSFVINLFVTSVFAVGFYCSKQADNVGLANAGQYLQDKYGWGLFPIFYIWGIGLLMAGQSSTITGTYAGQFIMSGFLNLRMKKWLRSLISRSCAIVPTIIVALVFKRLEAALDSSNSVLCR